MPIDISNQWTSNFNYIVEYANKKNREGIIFPIWATCLGYETFMYITSGSTDNTTVFTEVFRQGDKTCALEVRETNSELLRSLSPQEIEKVTSDDGLFYFHHRWAIE